MKSKKRFMIKISSLFLLLMTFLSLNSFAITNESDTLILIYAEPRNEQTPLYTFISVSNIEPDIDDELVGIILNKYTSHQLQHTDTLVVNTTLGFVHGRFEWYIENNTQKIKFYAFKYVWNNGTVLYIEDRKKY